jgi:hypothetical protein
VKKVTAAGLPHSGDRVLRKDRKSSGRRPIDPHHPL